MLNRQYIILKENDTNPVPQNNEIDKDIYAASSVANIELHFIMHSENELLFMRKIFWKDRYYVLVDSERVEEQDVMYEAEDHMSISTSIFDAIAKGKTLNIYQRSYEIESEPGRYMSFEHLIFETGLQIIQYEVLDTYTEAKKEPAVLEFIRKAYPLSDELITFDDSNWMLLNEWIKKYEN